VNESAVSAKEGLGLIGTRSAQSETPVRAAAERRPPELGRSGKRLRSHRWVKSRLIYDFAATDGILDSIKLLHINMQYV
jgi:hypothetical protein